MDVFISPASSAQSRMYFIDQLEPGNPVYHFPAGVRIKGKLHIRALEKSINEIVSRHEVLRTTFHLDNGEIVQVIRPELQIPLRQVQENEDSLQKAIQQEVHLPFNLRSGPLLRCVLFELSAEEYVLLITMHHIVSDGWSVGVFIREFSALYRAFINNRPSPLPEPELQYADFSEWHNEILASDAIQKQMAYWEEQLKDVSKVLHFPTDYPRPHILPDRGKTLFSHLDAELVTTLNAIAAEEGATLFMVLLTAFNILLYKYTEQEDFLVGTPVANRSHSETENLIGCFINTLPLRADLSGDPDFLTLLKRVKSTALAAYDHQDIPFERLVDTLQPERDRSRTPLFQVMMVLQNAPREELKLPGLQMEIMDIPLDTAKFDISLVSEQSEEGITIRWEYLSDLYSEETIRQLNTHYRNILCRICRNQHQPLSQFSILSEDERHTLLDRQAAPPLSGEWHKGLHELFAEQAAKTPNRIAIVSGEKQITYRTLDNHANRVANHLVQKGVKPGTFVGLCTDRSLEMITGIVGILKAGCVYVPLDPSYPSKRLSFLISDSRVKLILSDGAFPEALQKEYPDIPVISFISDKEAIEQQDTTAPRLPFSFRDHAYVIYTSGSTGTPKGVLISHRNVVRLFSSTREWFQFHQDDVWTLFHSFAFDFSVWEIWGALLFGGKLVIVPHMVTRSPEEFYNLLIQEEVTILNQTPSAFKTLMPVDRERQGKLSLRFIIFGGEALELSALRSWFERHGDTTPQLVNMYGITETTVHVTYRPLKKEDAFRESGSLIGKPISDLSLFILDKNRQPVPAMVPGELYIGGAGLAEGYLHRPRLTAERFMKNPFGEGRLYKTGDLARRLHNGDIEYLGRSDKQVKIRGFRIEPGEIEAALLQKEDIREAAVIIREDTPGNKRIVAYIVKQNDKEETDADTLREYCSTRLPEHMVPVAFVFMEALPLNVNGKLDVSALEKPETAGIKPKLSSEKPVTKEEEILLAVWSKVLHAEGIGVDDNFFALGGDSILTLLVVSEVKKRGYHITPAQIFETESVTALAQVMQKEKESTSSGTSLKEQPFAEVTEDIRQRVKKERGEISDIYPLSPMQEGMLFHTLLSPESGNYFEQITGILEGELNEEHFIRSWRKVTERHAALRTTFLWLDTETPLQVVHPEVVLPFTKQDWREQNKEEQAENLRKLLQEDCRKGFDLQKPPLMRFTLIRLEEKCYRWVWSHHHMLLDGWSAGIIFKEVLHFYKEFQEGELTDTLSPPRSYRDFIAWQRSQDPRKAEEYWKKELADFREPTKIGSVIHLKEGSTVENLSEEVRLTEEETTRLRTWVQERKLTLNALVQGVWAMLLRRYGNEDIVFGVTNSGRPHDLEGAEETVGLFINTLPVRAPLGDNIHVTEWLKAFQEKQIKLMEYGYCKLADVQKCSGTPSEAPLFDSLVIFENYPVDSSLTMQTAGITSRHVSSFERTNYPLTLVAGPGKELFFRFHYDTDRFRQEEVQNLTRHYLHLLREVVRNPHQEIGELNLLTEEEKRKILSEWNRTEKRYQNYPPLPQLFEAQAEKTPDATAVESKQEKLSYRELNQEANRIARRLRLLGVKEEMPVALYMKKSVSAIIAFMGIFKAGGTYVPFAAETPEKRLTFMLQNAGVSFLITTEEDMKALSEQAQEEIFRTVSGIIDINSERKNTTAEENEENLPCFLKPQNAAYMIYTSGSTGEPKGTLLEHRGLTNLIYDHIPRFQLQEGSRLLQFAAFGFDASVLEISITLCSGARLCLEKEENLLAGQDLAGILQERGITHSFLPPTALRTLPPGDFPHLTTLWSAGEVCSAELAQRWSEGRNFFNAYGPTEATVCSSVYLCSGEEQAPPPIGYPLQNIRLYILDSHDQLLPPGITGELHISGPCLARGYHNLPALTEKKFIQNPFSTEKDYTRLYRTGDLCRYRNDGAIEFVGRKDQQIKLRGMRIETEEIEVNLRECPEVLEAVVILREDTPGTQRLTAYILLREDYKNLKNDYEKISSSLKEHLSKVLPAYMVPPFCVIMESFPLTLNGKIDRKALPAPEKTAVTREIIPPGNHTEKVLTEIWKKVLHTEHISIRDNFFELGGDSILSLQIISLAHRHGYIITPKQIFTSLTIENLAPEALPVEQGSCATTEEEEDSNGEVPLTPIQHWFFEQEQPDIHHWNQSLLLDVQAPLRLQLLNSALEAVMTRHQVLNFRYRKENNRWRQFIAEEPSPVNIAEFDLSGITGSQSEELEKIASELQGSLNLAHGPLMRAAYFRMGEQNKDKLLLLFHHLVIDGVSWRIILGDLIQAYTQLEQGEEVHLPPVAVSYRRWSLTRSVHACSEAVQKQIPFWTERKEVTPLKSDTPQQPLLNLAADTRSVTGFLTEEETSLLLREVHKAYGTRMNDILLASLLLAFQKYDGRNDLHINLEGHGRDDIGDGLDVSGTVGWFTCIYPVLLTCEQTDDPGRLLKSVKEQLRSIPMNGIGYGLLRYATEEESDIRKKLEAQPVPEISFNYLGQTGQLQEKNARFRIAEESSGMAASPRSLRYHLLDITGIVVNDRLKIDFLFNHKIHRRETIASLSEDFLTALRKLISHCLHPQAGGYTPSDFRNIELNEEELDSILDEIE